ncbi:hypothetical protein J6590_008525 [Homalodisca vitripennis]|nr:hypothetical protein J6590_008525 [Homalodisca vitripennis]
MATEISARGLQHPDILHALNQLMNIEYSLVGLGRVTDSGHLLPRLPLLRLPESSVQEVAEHYVTIINPIITAAQQRTAPPAQQQARPVMDDPGSWLQDKDDTSCRNHNVGS